MSTTSQVIGVILTAGLVVGICFLVNRRPSRSPSLSSVELPLEIVRPTALRTTTKSSPPTHFIQQLKYHNGVFVTPVTLGVDASRNTSRVIWCVVDTGSELLVVSNHTCVSEGDCAEEMGFYVQSNTYRAEMNDENDENLEIIHYGSQKDTVVPSSDILSLWSGDEDDQQVVFQTRLHFGLVKERQGSSNYNIMGLLNPQRVSSSNIEPFLSKLHSHLAKKCFSIFMHPEEGRISFGDPIPLRNKLSSKFNSTGRMSFVDFVSPDALPFPFYMIQLTSVKIGDHTLKNAPKYLLFDSGSNYGGVGTNVFKEMVEHGMTCSHGKDIVLEFEAYSNVGDLGQGTRTQLTLGPDVYCWSKTKTMLIEVEEPFGDQNPFNEEVFVFGSFFLHTFLLEFHLDEKRLGIQEL
jgi:hypothetical protein